MISHSNSKPSVGFANAATVRLPVRTVRCRLPLWVSSVMVGESATVNHGTLVGIVSVLVTTVEAPISAAVLDWRIQLAAGMPFNCAALAAEACGAETFVPSHQTSCCTPVAIVTVVPPPP